MMIIKVTADENGQHLFQSQSHRLKCWLDDYLAVPEELETKVNNCMGYCDLEIEGDVLKNIIPRPDLIPVEPEPDAEPTSMDLINAMLGVTSYE